MSHRSRRGRPPRTYRIRVRTERRDPIDYAALANAALEQAAMDQMRLDDAAVIPPRVRAGSLELDPPGVDVDEEGAPL